MSLTVALDIGTSGTRAAAVDPDGTLIATARVPGADMRRPDGTVDPEPWWHRAEAALAALVETLRVEGRGPEEIGAITADGTSGTLTLTDAAGGAVSPGLMYDSPHPTAAARAEALLPLANDPVHIAHQVDFVLARLGAKPGTTDPNNALKTGHDPESGWHASLRDGPLGPILPKVRPLHAVLGDASATARALGIPKTATIHAGTTDSVAAFLAAGPRGPGQAVTSLGSTTVLKLVSTVRVDDPARGVYSHRLGEVWLAGGASNAGGAGIAAALPGADLAALSARIDPDVVSPLDYHPLPRPGERFPDPDPAMPSRVAPRPPDDAAFLHGLLESVARIEARGYAALADLGAPRVTHVLTTGGGAANPQWTAIRARVLGVAVRAAPETDAAVGLARALARHRG